MKIFSGVQRHAPAVPAPGEAGAGGLLGARGSGLENGLQGRERRS